MSTDEELLCQNRLLESYKEQNASWKHHDRGMWGLTAFMIPVSFAALGAPYVYTQIPDYMPIAGGFFVMLFWCLSCEIYHNKNEIRFKIIHNMEKCMKVEGHKTWADKRKKYNTGGKRLLKSRYLRRAIFCVYSLAAASMLLWKCL